MTNRPLDSRLHQPSFPSLDSLHHDFYTRATCLSLDPLRITLFSDLSSALLH